MTRSVARWSVLLLALGPAAGADEPATDLKGLQGTWAVASAQEGGKEQAAEQSKRLSIVIDRDVFSFRFEGQPKALDMKLTVDPAARPKALDLASTVREGQVARGIYELAGDELKVCWSRNGKARPDGFATRPGDDRMFLTLKRVGAPDK
ncbi:MAG: hypothetical protein C0501_12250 [Isosphaera sp.]|nr:hypothetical protein [Isosphaera sp.]